MRVERAYDLGVELAAEVQGADLAAELHCVVLHYETDVGGLCGVAWIGNVVREPRQLIEGGKAPAKTLVTTGRM
jgi:hypothetical protein